MEPVSAVVWIVSFVVVMVAITGLSRKVGWSAPVALVAVGAGASFIPAVPRVELEPELVLYGLLPPLLFAAAVRTSVIDVRARRDSILLLSVGLVAFTVVVVAFATWWLVPAITLAAAFAFGAVVAPTDAVAVTAVTGKLGLPRRLVTVLEGESLLNDATALVALNAAIAAIVSIVNPWMVVGEFGLAVVSGIGFGLLVGVVMAAVRRRLKAPVLDTSLALVTPYIAFILAQLTGGSGVLAVVIAGLFLGYRAPVIQSAEARIAESINWRTVQFLLENAVFLFIGLNLASIIDGALSTAPGFWPTLGICLAVLVVIVLARFVWMFAFYLVVRLGPRRDRNRGINLRTTVAASVAGIRGVVTLAAVFLLPVETPGRAFLQFLAFVVVAGTLIAGLFLPLVIRRLRLPSPDLAQEEGETLRLVAEAQAAGLERLAELDDGTVQERVLTRLRVDSRFLAEVLDDPGSDDAEPLPASYGRLRGSMIEAERDAILAARSEGRYQEPAVRAALANIDMEEALLRARRARGPEQNLA